VTEADLAAFTTWRDVFNAQVEQEVSRWRSRDSVQDGRHLMENDGHEPEARRHRPTWFWPADVAVGCHNYKAILDAAPEHPNYRFGASCM
jgi:hypothetical protein